jgi:hypothetical protein
VGHHRKKQIPVHVMLGGVQLIHVAEGEKDVFVPVIALYRLREEYRANRAAELHCSYPCLVLIRDDRQMAVGKEVAGSISFAPAMLTRGCLRPFVPSRSSLWAHAAVVQKTSVDSPESQS